jgi:hypothetical protein
MRMEQPEVWRVVNPTVKCLLGYPVGYEVMGGDNALSLLVPEDYPPNAPDSRSITSG